MGNVKRFWVSSAGIFSPPTKQAISIKLATTAVHFLRDLDFANSYDVRGRFHNTRARRN